MEQRCKVTRVTTFFWNQHDTELDSDNVVGRMKVSMSKFPEPLNILCYMARIHAGCRKQWSPSLTDFPEIRLDYPGQPKGSNKGPLNGEERSRGSGFDGFEVEKGAMSPRMQEASRSWKRQGKGFSPGASRRRQSCDTSILAWRNLPPTLISSIIRCWFALLKPPCWDHLS